MDAPNEITVKIKFKFSDDLTPQQKENVLQTVANHLKHDIDSAGVVDDDANCFTVGFDIKQVDNPTTLSVKFI